MNEITILGLALIGGASLGAFFFGGLWLTVVKGLPSKSPGLWFAISLILRLGITMTGFYFVSGGHWDRLLACLAGFIAVRFVMIRFTQSFLDKQTQSIKGKEASHESQS